MALPVRVNVGVIRDWGGLGTATLTTAARSLTAGNTLIVSIGAQDIAAGSAAVTAVTDTAGNTYIKVDHAYQASDFRVELWYAKNVLGHATNQVTITFAGAVQYRGAVAAQYAGLDPTAPFDASAKATQASGSGITTGTLTTTAADEVHILVARFGVTPTYPAGFSDLGGDLPYLQVQEKIVSATMSGTYATSGGSFQTVILVAAFKAAVLARVQSTGKVVASSAASVALTFAAPPTVGNGIVVGVISSDGAGFSTTACTDNRGNTYSRDRVHGGVISTESITVYSCPKITASGSPFTVTISPAVGSRHFVAVAIEVSGVGLGLAVDVASSGNGISTAPGIGTTPALTPNVFALALTAISAAQASISVGTADSLTPGWTEEAEQLTFGPPIAGEIDSRVLAAATTAIDVRWTCATSGWWVAGVVAYKATAAAADVRATHQVTELLSQPTPDARVSHYLVETLQATPPPDARVTQDALELLSLPILPVARVTQAPLELLSASVAFPAAGRVTQAVIEILGPSLPPPAAAQVTQAAVELLGPSAPIPVRLTQASLDVFLQRPAGLAATQLALEVFARRSAALRATHLALETWRRVNAAIRFTHTAVEVWRHDPGRLRATQLVVELWVILPPCVPADFPVDTVPAGGSCSPGLFP